MAVSEALGERRTGRVPAGTLEYRELVERSRTFIPEDNPAALVDSLRRFL